MHERSGEVRGLTTVLGLSVDTTGVLGVSGPEQERAYRAFPAWLTVPSYQDLATGRVVHFFFAWMFAVVYSIWLVASAINGHLRRDILPALADIRALPATFIAHLRLRF